MKPVTKENLLEAIQKVEDQGKLTHFEYEDETGCRCIIGHLMTDEELAELKEDERNDTSIETLILQSDFTNVAREEYLILAKLQNLNDNLNLPLKDFVELARNHVEELFA